jgi:hypothetical protein
VREPPVEAENTPSGNKLVNFHVFKGGGAMSKECARQAFALIVVDRKP